MINEFVADLFSQELLEVLHKHPSVKGFVYGIVLVDDNGHLAIAANSVASAPLKPVFCDLCDVVLKTLDEKTDKLDRRQLRQN